MTTLFVAKLTEIPPPVEVLLTEIGAATTNPDSRYIFSIEDGITDLSQLTLGLKNFVLSRTKF